MALFAKAFGKNNLVFYKSGYTKPTEVNDSASVDAYLDYCQFIDFGVDISKLEEKKPPKSIERKKFIRKEFKHQG